MKLLNKTMSVLILLAAVACTKNQTEELGRVAFEVSSNDNIADATRSNVSDYASLPSAGDFTISITDAASASVWSGKLSEWDAATLLTAGNYNVTATYGSIEDEGFDRPFFTGTTSFTVLGGQTVPVTVNVALGNTVVYISCTDNFKNYYSDYTFKFTRDGSDVVTFVKDETKAAFIDGYKITLEGTVYGQKTQTFKKDYTSLAEATAYRFEFDASNVGGASITVTFNETVEEVPLGDIELNE